MQYFHRMDCTALFFTNFSTLFTHEDVNCIGPQSSQGLNERMAFFPPPPLPLKAKGNHQPPQSVRLTYFAARQRPKEEDRDGNFLGNVWRLERERERENERWIDLSRNQVNVTHVVRLSSV